MRPPSWLEDVLRDRVPCWTDMRVSADEVLDACRSFEVSELVHDRLMRARADHGWPRQVRRELDLRAHRAAAHELVRAREIVDLLGALAAQNVGAIILKGTALAYTVYDSPMMRPRVDTDLLIARDRVPVAREIFRACGYIEPPMTDGELVFCQFQMTKIDAFGIEHIFDVHWKISTQTLFANLLTFDELDADAVPLRALGLSARVPCPPHALLLACIHPVMHHRNTDRLIWNYDVHLLVQRMSKDEMDGFVRLALDKRVAGVCARQLSTAQRFGTPVSVDVMSALTSPASTEAASVYLRARRRWHDEVLWNIRGLHSWRERVRLVREILFPDPRYMLNAYHLGRTGVILLPALYIHRCARGAVNVIAGRK
jgi:putative nucleotidyltransferase-like protein